MLICLYKPKTGKAAVFKNKPDRNFVNKLGPTFTQPTNVDKTIFINNLKPPYQQFVNLGFHETEKDKTKEKKPAPAANEKRNI